MDDIINTFNPELLPLKNFEVSEYSRTMEYCKRENRICYFNKLTQVTVIPLLHVNQNKFMGIKEPGDYFAFKVIKDKFIALHKKGELQTWNLITGKYIKGVQL